MSADCALSDGVWVHGLMQGDKCGCVFAGPSIMSNSSTGSAPIPSSSVDPSLLPAPTSTPVPPLVFYSQSTRNRPVTPPLNASIQYSHIEQDIWPQLRLRDR